MFSCLNWDIKAQFGIRLNSREGKHDKYSINSQQMKLTLNRRANIQYIWVYIKYIAKYLLLKQNMITGFGRYLVATRDIKPGEIIFTGEYILYCTRDFFSYGSKIKFSVSMFILYAAYSNVFTNRKQKNYCLQLHKKNL